MRWLNLGAATSAVGNQMMNPIWPLMEKKWIRYQYQSLAAKQRAKVRESGLLNLPRLALQRTDKVISPGGEIQRSWKDDRRRR